MKSALFRYLAQVLDSVKRTPSKKEKVKVLAAYLRGLTPDDAEQAAQLATGRSSERGSRLEVQVGYSIIMASLKEITGATSAKVSKAYLRFGDLGELAEDLLKEKKEQSLFDEPLSLSDLKETFDKLRNAKGTGSVGVRKALVRSLLLRASPPEGKYIVKVLTGEMRTGLVSGLMEEAISDAYSVPREETARAHMLLGDVGLLARAAAEGTTNMVSMVPFRPLSFMLAEPIATAAEIEEHYGKRVYAERKYDGVRAQVHKLGDQVRMFSRRLEDITDSFPEVRALAAKSSSDFIIDGEVVPFEDEKPLPFQLLQRRLRRKERFEEAARRAPVEFFAFDILFLDGKEVSTIPLAERRRMLEHVCARVGIRRAESVEVKTAADIEKAFALSRRLGYEGLVLKDPESAYGMGKRGSAWVKLKEELDTIDAVVVAAEYGHGKRAGVISDYTFAVRDGDMLRTIGKAYSGLTDTEIAELTSKLKELTLVDSGYRRTVRPEIVLEVAFDSIQQSGRHDSGYALRFPRIKRIRTDKSTAEIDSIEKVTEIFRRQTLKLER